MCNKNDTELHRENTELHGENQQGELLFQTLII